MTTPIRLRFAPSPNGALHLGHALSALLNQEAARRLGGSYLLRLEDIDAERCTSAKETALLADLAWLGAMPTATPLRQSERFALYRDALERLREKGLVYRCFASRGDIARAVGHNPARDPDGAPLYPGLWRHASQERIDAALAAGKSFAWRLDSEKALTCLADGRDLHWTESGGGQAQRQAANPAAWGDIVLARKDVPASYHLAAIVDDAAQSITHIVRGRDLKEATSLHVLLQALLGLPQPLYHHHRLILDVDGRKLSKSDRSTSLQSLRESGATRDDILRLIGWAPDRDLAGL